MSNINLILAADPSEAPDPSAVTSLEGTTFCISSRSGDIEPGLIHGLFVRDTRFVSFWQLSIDGITPEPLSSIVTEPFATTFVARTRLSRTTSAAQLLIVRNRFVGDGMREDIELRNLTPTAYRGEVRLQVGTDFAHVFEVKDGRVRPRGFHSVEVAGRKMVFAFRDGGSTRRLDLILPKGVEAGPGLILLPVELGPYERMTTNFEFHVTVDDQVMEPRHHRGRRSGAFAPATRLKEWRWSVPKVTVDHDGLALTLARAGDDLGALRIFDPDQPDEAVIAAGAPWYMALFGRDSLITSYMTLPVDQNITEDTLRSLARHQGDRVDAEKDEQPGKILHEMRFRFDGPTTGSSRSAYYGSIDSTPLFVMLLGEARRWGLSRSVVDELLPAADRAIEWIERYGDRDGDGFVEYEALSPRGFPNQGWKDSPDGINFADGTIAHAPIALCEVQGYVYAAYVLRAELATESGDKDLAAELTAKAEKLKVAFNAAFYLPKLGYFAIGLDGDKRPIDALTSNIGHCLWTGIIDEDKAASVAKHLLSPEMFSGFGIRTLASSMGAFNPISYHNGSVWPHDNAIAIAGLMRYGFTGEAHKVALGLIDAAEGFRGRLPELFCGLERSEFPEPVAYPSACSPQAWASAAVFSLLRSLLRLEPRIAENKLYLAPSLPKLFSGLRIENLQLASTRISIDTTFSPARLSGEPKELELIEEPAAP